MDRRRSHHVSPRFETTHWSMVVAASGGPTPRSREALSRLCEMYWYPLYAYVRRRGYDADAAQDLTQEFFTRVIEKDYLSDATPERGRFRAFLLASLRHFLANEYDRASAQKRGGGRPALALEFETAEGRYQLEPPDTCTPETIYERRWALTVLDRTLTRLRAEHEAAGRLALFDRLKGYLTGDASGTSYAEAASALGMSEGAVKVAVHRLRRRFGALLREEIADTVVDPAQIDDEIRALFAALG
jgi:RNA polymerase sigma-70 factor (ECF subfamily)